MISVTIEYYPKNGEHYLKFETDKEIFGIRLMESRFGKIPYPGGKISAQDVKDLIKFLEDCGEGNEKDL